MEKKLKVLVLAGGNSEERPVSLVTGKAVSSALKRLGYEIDVIDTVSGQSLIDEKGRFLLETDTTADSRLALKSADTGALTEALNRPDYRDLDLVFIALHGGSGEDGTIQALLDLAGIKYTGSGMLASALAMNKALAKRLVAAEGIPTPDWLLFRVTGGTVPDNTPAQIKAKFACPIIIKPNNSGSTFGLTLVKDEGGIGPALERAAAVSPEILVEQYVKGREITCAVLDGESLPLVEIVPTNELYDYQCKYTKGKSEYICPAEIPGKTGVMIRDYAHTAYNIINCAGLTRVDFILDTEMRPFFLEVNTIPGLTELSLAPMAARQVGIDFDGLIRKLCDAALKG